MRSVGYRILIPGCTLGVLLLWSCGGDGGCGGPGGAGDVCPPPAYGYAQVNGHALRSDGSPVAGRVANVGCGDAVGAYSDRTDAGGNFEVRLVYAVFDTLLNPFPPREADGSFTVSCQANLPLPNNALLVQNPLPVLFAPTPAGVVPTLAELREESLSSP